MLVPSLALFTALLHTGLWGTQVAQGVWALRRLGAQEPLRVGCPRVCIELMYQSSGYRTRFDIKQAFTSIYQPPPARRSLLVPEAWCIWSMMKSRASEAVGLMRHRQWSHNNGAMPHGEGSCVRNIAACSETAQAHPAPPRLAVAQSSPLVGRAWTLRKNADESQKSGHVFRCAFTRATTPLE